MKLVKENCVSQYGENLVKWWLKDGTKHLPSLYIMSSGYNWCAYDANDKLIYESLCADLRLKKHAVEWLKSYDENKDIELAKEAAEQAEYDAKHAELKRIENEYNESFKKDVDVNFTAQVGDIVRVKMFSLSKLNSLGDAYVYGLEYNYNPTNSNAKIEEIKVVSQAEYDAFVDSFYDSSLSSSFSGGGTYIDNAEINKYKGYADLPNHLRDYYDKNCYELVTIVIADKRHPIVVNPQGYTYVRYAGLVA